jgi:hypothetical protein
MISFNENKQTNLERKLHASRQADRQIKKLKDRLMNIQTHRLTKKPIIESNKKSRESNFHLVFANDENDAMDIHKTAVYISSFQSP